jgi:hypothetical protein
MSLLFSKQKILLYIYVISLTGKYLLLNLLVKYYFCWLTETNMCQTGELVPFRRSPPAPPISKI